MNIRVEPAPRAGHALIHVPGAAAAAGKPAFGIRRDEDWGEDKLGPDGWQTSDAALSPDGADVAGGDLVLRVGWSVCRHLESGMYTLWLPAAGVTGAAMQWPHIQPEHAGSRDVFSPAPPPIDTKTAETVQPPPIAPSNPLVAPPPTRSRLPWLIGAALLLAAAAGVAVWQPWKAVSPSPTPLAAPTTQPEPPPPAPPPAPPPTPIPPPAPAPVEPPPPLSLNDMSVPDVLAKAPNPAAITAEGQRRLAGARHDDGLLLLEAAADRGDGTASAALAKLYDPVGFQPGIIPKPDPRQAARYYRDAARAGVDVGAARDALHQQLERDSQGGNLGAGLTLKDFWP